MVEIVKRHKNNPIIQPGDIPDCEAVYSYGAADLCICLVTTTIETLISACR